MPGVSCSACTRLPLTVVDRLCGFRAGPVSLELTPGRVSARAGGQTVEVEPIDIDFPDYRRLVSPAGPQIRRVAVDAAVLRERLVTAPVVAREHDGSAYPVSVLGLDPWGELRVAAESEWQADAAAHVAVNREFLLQALDAGAAGQLVLELDGPLRPLAVRVPGDGSRFSLLMPVRH